jgi:CRISPR-associated protein Cas1
MREARPEVIERLRELSRMASSAASVNSLFGIEGDAAAIYFRCFPSMLSPTARVVASSWPGRTGRGATDEINVALNLVYGLLLGDQLRAVVAAGLDPHAGFLHSSKRNKPALALDLMEQFRPVAGDSVVLGALNNGELTPAMYTRVLGEARLRDSGRRALVAAYERRVQTEFKHPVFGYRVTWRRAMEVQARMVLGVLDGSQDRYIGVRVR